MRLLLHQMDPSWYAPLAEAGNDISFAPPPGQMTYTTQNGSTDPLPIVLGAAVAFGTVSFIAFMSLIIRVSCRRARIHHLSEAAIQQQHAQHSAATAAGGGAGNGAGVARSSSENKERTPPRIPVIVIEPDATMEVAYRQQTENENSPSSTATPTTPTTPAATTTETDAHREVVPMWRTPTVSRLSAYLQALEPPSDPEIKPNESNNV